MNCIKSRWNAMLVVVGLAGLLGCQGFSSKSQNLAPGQLTAAPTSISFGNVQIGTSQTLSGAVSNTGASSITVTQATVTGTGFSISGMTPSVTLTAGQSANFSVLFAPTSAGSASGNIAFSTASGTVNVTLSGTGIAPGSLATSPTSISFGNVVVGDSSPEAEMLTNTGGSDLTVTAATISGTGFSYSGLNLPLTLTPTQTSTFSVNFAPTAAGASTGNLSLTVSGSTSSVGIALSGTGVAATQNTLSVTNPIGVGSVVDGLSGTQTGTLTATGGTVLVSSVSLGGSNPAEFSISGLTFPVTVTTSQPVSFTVTFTPGATGAASATASFVSNASNSPSVASLSGTGTAAPVHTVQLSWAASLTEGVTSYNVYRAVYGSTSCGSYTDIGSTSSPTTTYTDNSVTDGTTYCYATTAVDPSGESAYSNITQATIPAP